MNFKVFTHDEMETYRTLDAKIANLKNNIYKMDKNRYYIMLDFKRDNGVIKVTVGTTEGFKTLAYTKFINDGVTSEQSKRTTWLPDAQTKEYMPIWEEFKQFVEEIKNPPKKTEKITVEKPVNTDEYFVKGLKAAGKRVWAYKIGGIVDYVSASTRWGAKRKIKKALMAKVSVNEC